VSRRRVLIVSPDAVDAQMAGPAIRAWQMASVLAEDHDVHLVSTASATRTSDRFPVTGAAAGPAADWAEVVVIHPSILRTHPALVPDRTPLVVDLYDPFHLENLEPDGTDTATRSANVAHLTSVIDDAVRRGDFFLCASDRQRDFWLGTLAAHGRLNPRTYDLDPTLRALIDVVPFGISSAPPVKRRTVLRGVVPGIGSHDHILLWGGGVYNWFDPVTLIEAVDRLREGVPTVRLVFLGMGHPNAQLPTMRQAVEARRRSQELGLTDRYVFFNEGWVPYDERGDHLLEADVGVSTHGHHVETDFSFRTRMLDYLWAGLPIVTTEGDVFAELAVAEAAGAAVPAGDVAALARALHQLLRDDAHRRGCARQAAALAARFHWEQVLVPLRAFCTQPAVAPDRDVEAPVAPAEAAPPADEVPPPPRRWLRRPGGYIPRSGARN